MHIQQRLSINQRFFSFVIDKVYYPDKIYSSQQENANDDKNARKVDILKSAISHALLCIRRMGTSSFECNMNGVFRKPLIQRFKVL